MGELELLSSARLPQEFGNYAILEHLATGGMAEVYIARQTGMAGFERLVIIKRVRADMLGARELIASLLDEARLVATLQHPNIAQVYEIGCVNDSYFFAMEYVPGADLRRIMERSVTLGHRISVEDAVYIAIQICIALQYAHEKRDATGASLGIVHRDVTPSNILVSNDGAVKICDFGIAKATTQTHETAIGTLKGKYGYMSPEQCRCMPLDRRSDIFSLGILLYELSTLTRAFVADSDFELLRSIIAGPPPPPSSRVADYPPELERIVMRALATDPDARYPTAQDMQLDLEALARECQLALSSVNIAELMAALFGGDLRGRGRAASMPPIGPPKAALGSGSALAGRLESSTGNRSNSVRRNHAAVLPDLQGSRRVAAESLPILEIIPDPAVAPVAPAARVRGRANPLWLVLAVLAIAVTVAGSFAGRELQRNTTSAATAVLTSDAERIAGMLEVSHRLARGRAIGIATMPILRAAIETDAATVADIAERDAVFSVGADETLEVFQLRNGEAVSLLRLPSGAPSMAPLRDATVRLSASGDIVTLVAAAPVGSATATAGTATGTTTGSTTGTTIESSGEVAISTRVDLGPAKAVIAQHASEAWLRGAGLQLRLVGTSDAAPGHAHTIPVQTSRELGSLDLTLVAVPHTSSHGWLVMFRVAGVIVAGLSLAWYLWSRWRKQTALAVPSVS